MRIEVLQVTPAMAMEWMSRNTHNRPMNKKFIERLVDDMRNGRWKVTHQGIAFGPDMTLLDGQHRLQAVINSGCTVTMVAAFDVPRDAQRNFDTGIIRTLVHAMLLDGRKQFLMSKNKGSSGAMWRAMMMCGRAGGNIKGKVTNEAMFAFQDRYADAGLWTIGEFGKYPYVRLVTTSSQLGAVARAYYHYQDDLDRLAEFIEVLATGVNELERNRTAIHFRNMLISQSGRNINRTEEFYGKATVAIKAFMEYREIRKFYRPSEDLFPLPDGPVPGRAGRSYLVPGNARRDEPGALRITGVAV